MEPQKNKVAIITDSSRGIGDQTAQALALSEAKVIINYAGNQQAADELVLNIRNNGGFT